MVREWQIVSEPESLGCCVVLVPVETPLGVLKFSSAVASKLSRMENFPWIGPSKLLLLVLTFRFHHSA
jgi:hypothetical protein